MFDNLLYACMQTRFYIPTLNIANTREFCFIMSTKQPRARAQTRALPIVPPILPEMVPNYAWALTLGYSEDEEAKGRADNIRNRLEEIKRTVHEKAKGKKADEIESADRLYVDSVLAAIDSCERTLLTIIRGRNQNFKETDRLMDTQIKNAEASSRVMLNFHSALPRVFATGGGAAGTVLVKFFLDSVFKIEIPDEVLYSAAVVAAGAVYGIYQLMVAPETSKRAQQEIVKNDYRRNVYYKSYLARSRGSLNALFSEILNIYERVYGEKYEPKYDNEEERQKVVMNAIGGSEALSGKWCPKIHEHYHKNKITPVEWTACESAIGYEKCSKWLDEPKQK